MKLFNFFRNKPSVYDLSREWIKENKIPLFESSETSSTNVLAKEEAFSLSTPLKIYISDQQRSGRGRGKNSWSNPPPGTGLLVSFSYEVSGAPQPITGPLIGLSLYRALQSTYPDKSLSIKPPNDIYLENKKIAGILVETLQMGERFRLIIGIGLNVTGCPEGVEFAGYLLNQNETLHPKWGEFLDKLKTHLNLSAQGVLASHLSEQEREELLLAINNKPNLDQAYSNISPFGDLTLGDKIISWRTM